APLTARFPFEMFHGVGDVHPAARDARVLERLVEHRAGGSDKRRPPPIFLIAPLLAYKHHPPGFGAGTQNDLSGCLVQVAPAAFMCGRGQGANTARCRDKRRSRALTAGVAIVRAAGRLLLRHGPTSSSYCPLAPFAPVAPLAAFAPTVKTRVY